MIRHVSINIAGPYHIDKGIECQDNYYYKEVNDHVVVAAVADGLGSEKYSKIGSEIASRVAVEHIASIYSSELEFSKVKSLMNNAFVYAYKAVLEKVEEMQEDPNQFDTTLCLGILDDQHLYYGQSGDSGMIALLSDGSYCNVVDTQNDEEGRVFPLCEGPNMWEFGELSEPVSSVMLMTDGIYLRFVNKLLKYDSREINGRHIEVNVPFAEMLMRRSEQTDEEITELQDQLVQFFRDYPREKIDDDKTLVLIYNPELQIKRMPEEYYCPADYDKLRELAKADYYRSLGYSQEPESEEELEVNPVKSESISSADYRPSECESLGNKEDKKERHSNGIVNSNEMLSGSDTLLRSDPDAISTESLRVFKESEQKKTNDSCSKTNHTPIQQKSSKHIQANNGNTHQNLLIDIVILFIVLLFGVAAFFATDLMKQYASITYVSILFICFLSNATVLLPAPSTLIVLEYALILNPILVAICGGLGAALGEITGFLVGHHSKQIINKSTRHTNRISRFFKWLETKFNKHPYIIVFVFSVIPLPLFDFIGILAGAVKLNPMKFFCATLLGKIIKMLFYVIAIASIAPMLSDGAIKI